MPDKFQPLSWAKVEFDEQGVPFSTDFGDVYFSRQSGMDETYHVFIDGNDLVQRWSNLDEDKPGHFVIAETGFGSGLNFLVAWQVWRQYAPQSWRLHFISTEKFPMRKADIAQCISLWPELTLLSQLLLDNYPQATPGFHYMQLDESVSLHLLLGDATQGLKQLLATSAPLLAEQTRQVSVDAWFLDGFNPKANTQLWHQDLFNCMAQLSNNQTTVATFTVSSMVKKGLQTAGFSIVKRPGFARKREMLTASYQPQQQTKPQFRHASPYQTPWHVTEKLNQSPPLQKQVIVMGAGLAGCHVAHALAERGYQVTVFEKNQHIASEASGNAQGVLYTKLSPYHSPLADFVLSSYLYANRFYSKLTKEHDIGCLNGLIQLAYHAKEQKLQRELASLIAAYPDLIKHCNATELSELSGIPLSNEGLFWPHSGWLKPASLCRSLLTAPNIDVITAAQVTNLRFDHKRWRFEVGDTNYQASIVVMALGVGVTDFCYTENLPLKPIKGQVSYWQGNARSHELKRALCSDGYLLPVDEHGHSLGATYNLGKTLNDSIEQNNSQNLAKLKHFGLTYQTKEEKTCEQRSSYRLATPDYMPLVGPVADTSAMQKRFGYFSKNAHAFIDKAGCYFPNLYMAAGFGSRALTYTPLCSQYLAALINNEPLPISDTMARYLSPARFIIRDIARKK